MPQKKPALPRSVPEALLDLDGGSPGRACGAMALLDLDGRSPGKACGGEPICAEKCQKLPAMLPAPVMDLVFKEGTVQRYSDISESGKVWRPYKGVGGALASTAIPADHSFFFEVVFEDPCLSSIGIASKDVVDLETGMWEGKAIAWAPHGAMKWKEGVTSPYGKFNPLFDQIKPCTVGVVVRWPTIQFLLDGKLQDVAFSDLDKTKIYYPYVSQATSKGSTGRCRFKSR